MCSTEKRKRRNKIRLSEAEDMGCPENAKGGYSEKMQALLAPLLEFADYQEIRKEIRKEKGIIQISGCADSQKTHLMYGIGDGWEYRVIAFSSAEKAKKVYEEYKVFTDSVCIYPARDLLFYYADIKGKTITDQRMSVLRTIIEKKEENPVTVITTMDAFLDGLPHPRRLHKEKIVLRGGDTLDLTGFENRLSVLGYERESQIEGPGQFAVRGGILDVFPLTEELPARIELWGDEIDSIRSFDTESQRSIENLEEITIFPASENWKEGMETVSFLEFFPKEKTLLFFDEPQRLQEMAQEVEMEYFHSRESRIKSGIEESDHVPFRVFETKDIIGAVNSYSAVALTTLEQKCGLFRVRKNFSIQSRAVNPYNNSFELLTRDLKRLKREKYRVVLLSASRTRAKRLAEDLRDYGLSSFYSEDMNRTVNPGEIMISCGYMAEGYEYPMLKFTVLSETDIFGRRRKRKRRKNMKVRRSMILQN